MVRNLVIGPVSTTDSSRIQLMDHKSLDPLEEPKAAEIRWGQDSLPVHNKAMYDEGYLIARLRDSGFDIIDVLRERRNGEDVLVKEIGAIALKTPKGPQL